MSTPDYTPNWSQLFVESTPQWVSYIDLENDVKPVLQIPPADYSRDATLQQLIDSACWFIQDYLGRPVAPTEFARRFDGWSGYSGSYIELPYAPVLKVISVTEWWGSNGPQVLTQQIPENQAGGSQVYALDALRGRISRVFAGLVNRPFFPGVGNVEICWVSGWNPVPPPIRWATMELITYWWRNTQQASRTGPRGSSEYGGAVDPANTLWPGIPNRCFQLLQTFEQYAIG